MVSDYSHYYGSVFTYLIDHARRPLKIRKVLSTQGFYLLEEKIPLYIKYSRKRKGPWTFNFRHDHQILYSGLVKDYGDCITALVCGKDGVVGLNHHQIRQVLDENFEEQESVSVRRKLKKMYTVTGSNGDLSRKVARDSLIGLAVDALGAEVISATSFVEGAEVELEQEMAEAEGE